MTGFARRRHLSLRNRLTLAAALAVAVAAASWLVYLLVRQQVHAEVDASLQRRVVTVREARAVREDDDDEPERYARTDIGEAGSYVQLLHADGRTLRSAAQAELLPVTEQALAVARVASPASLSTVYVGSAHVRLLTAPLRPGVAIQVARTLRDSDATLARLRLVLLLVAVGGVALAAALGRLVARTALAPVGRLSAAAERVTATRDLGHRIEVTGTDEVARLAGSFNAMLGALQAAVEAQRRLVADASHELRTPLTSLRTNLEVLAADRPLPPEDRRRLLADVVAQLDELSGLVGDLVLLSRGEEPTPAAEEVRLDAVVGAAVRRMRRHWPDVRFAIDLRPGTVTGDAARLDRAVGNLLDNAAKWSPPGEPVDVTVVDGVVTVRDRGPGIAAEDLPYVFDRFYRAASARGLPGSGLGLAIVRQVAEAHAGSVTAEAAPGGGTLLRLRIPSRL